MLAAAHRLNNLGNGIFSDVKLDANRLELGNDNQRRRAVGLDNVTNIYQAQTARPLIGEVMWQ